MSVAVTLKLSLTERRKLAEYLHCVKCIQIRCYFWSEYSKIRTGNNSVFGHFSRSCFFSWNQKFFLHKAMENPHLSLKSARRILTVNWNQNQKKSKLSCSPIVYTRAACPFVLKFCNFVQSFKKDCCAKGCSCFL